MEPNWQGRGSRKDGVITALRKNFENIVRVTSEASDNTSNVESTTTSAKPSCDADKTLLPSKRLRLEGGNE